MFSNKLFRTHLLLLLLLPVLCPGQNDFADQDSLIKKFNIKERLKYLYRVNSKDSLLIEKAVYDSSGHQTDHYTYNMNGLIVSRKKHQYDELGVLKQTEKIKDRDKTISHYSYDAQGRLVLTVSKKPDSSITTIISKEYYKDDLVSAVYRKDEDSKSAVPIQLTEYDSSDRVTSRKWFNSKGKVETSHFLSYDDDYQKVYVYSDKKKKKLTTIKKYNAKGQLIEILNVKYNRTTRYNYEPNGLLSYSTVHINGLYNHLLGTFYLSKQENSPLMFPPRKL